MAWALLQQLGLAVPNCAPTRRQAAWLDVELDSKSEQNIVGTQRCGALCTDNDCCTAMVLQTQTAILVTAWQDVLLSGRNTSKLLQPGIRDNMASCSVLAWQCQGTLPPCPRMCDLPPKTQSMQSLHDPQRRSWVATCRPAKPYLVATPCCV